MIQSYSVNNGTMKLSLVPTTSDVRLCFFVYFSGR